MTEHRLDPLLKPASIALLGASERVGSPGQLLAQMVIESAYQGDIYPVNPGYSKIFGRDCYPDLAALPARAEHVVIALGNAHLESALRAAIEHGAKAATIFSSAVLEADSQPPLKQRLADMATAAGIQICGLNGMGFYNLEQQLHVGIFPRPAQIVRGSICWIAQSGSAFTSLCHNGCRLGFNLCVSTGDEISTTIADYMDWGLDQSATRVIGLFLEAVRDPLAFVAVLEKARLRDIPVVVLKIGKSPLGASMAVTHTGAIAGNHAVFRALCAHHGVIEVDDFDEMAATLMLLQGGHAAASGGFAAAFESGGFRELVSDTAFALGLEFAPLESATIETIGQHLDPGLKAENPLDVWGSHDRFETRIEACLRALMQDPNVGAGAFFSNFRDGYFLSEAIYRIVETVGRETGKLLVLANCYSDLANTAICRRGYADGVAVLDGTAATLLAFKNLFAYHEFRQEPAAASELPALNQTLIDDSRQKLNRRADDTLDESEALALLGDFAISVVKHEIIDTETELLRAARAIGYPLVLKTAQPGINHKSDCGGVFVDVQHEYQLSQHYRDISARLGPQALVSRMVGEGIEIALGTINDRQFGPVIMVAAGGILVELLADRALAMCPVSPAEAEAMLDTLKVNRLLLGLRGRPAANRQALIEAIVNLSRLAFALRDSIAEIDINPVIVGSDDAIAVDALITTIAHDARAI